MFQAGASPYEAAQACVGGEAGQARLRKGGLEIRKRVPRAPGWKPPAQRCRAVLLGDGGGDGEAHKFI
jgi:hypothetical protein